MNIRLTFVSMFEKALHITLASLVYLSSMGLTINKHFCQGNLKDVAIFAQVDTCSGHCSSQSKDQFELIGVKDMSPKSCCSSSTDSDPKDCGDENCCDFETEFVQLDIEHIVSDHLTVPLALTLVFIVDANLFSAWTGDLLFNTQRKFQFYHPPSIITDIPVLIQRFLI